MLRKLLKYDFQSVFKYWWIAAITSFVLSLIGGGFVTPIASEKETPTMVMIASIIVLSLVVLSYAAFALLSEILVFARFYKNFFTDEGYLTFTLPVKRIHLLNSKLILSVTTTFVTGVVCVINILTLLAIGFSKTVFTKEFFVNLIEVISKTFNQLGVYLIIYILEALLLFILSIVFSSLFLFCCITFAAIITKKAKVITAIGIYYFANSIFSSIVQILYLFGFTSISSLLEKIPEYSVNAVVALMLLVTVLFMAAFSYILYILQYWMIDKKLNLS